MSQRWVDNGFIVQKSEPTDENQTILYNGISRFESWPLNSIEDETCRLLDIEMEERWFGYFYDDDSYALAVVPSIDFVNHYLNICKSKGIATRVLLVCSKRLSPKCEETKNFTKVFLGYDYATSQSFYSSLLDDLFGAEIPENIGRYRQVLNHNGLFDNQIELEKYILDRKISIDGGYNLESHGDFLGMKLYQVFL